MTGRGDAGGNLSSGRTRQVIERLLRERTAVARSDGSFHTLKVIVNSSQKASLQVRRGYWAPKHAEDELAVSKQEIESAVFSREEIHNLHVEMHTQVTKTGEQAKLNVLASVDLKQLQTSFGKLK